MVREATEERTAGESLKRADSGRKRGVNYERKNLISRNRKREKGRKQDVTAAYFPTSS